MTYKAPLDGVTVLDLSRVLAGPYATQRLADLGATVIKVEKPGEGDETRSWGPPWQPGDGQSSYFTALNRGKRSIAIDFGKPKGLELIMRLAETADVVIHNLRPGTAERLGLGYGDLTKVNPRLILCRITGFGDGRQPLSRPGYDLVVQAESGLMAITGEPDGGPSKLGVAITDVLTGLEAATAVLAGLIERDRTGLGVDIEVSLLDSALAALVNVGQGALAEDAEPQRFGNAHPSIVPYQPFGTSDGDVVIAASNDGLWVKLCEALRLPDLAHDPRFATNPDRVANRTELTRLLGLKLATEPSEHWMAVLSAAGVPCGHVLGVKEAIVAAASAGQAATVVLEGGTEVIGPPARFRGVQAHATSSPPDLGEHTDEVLGGLGLGVEEISALKAGRVVS